MDTYEAIKERRSIRKFKDKPVDSKILKKCVNAARLSPTAANIQPLKFITITKKSEEIFYSKGNFMGGNKKIFIENIND